MSVYTEDKLDYSFFPVKKHSVVVGVKASHDAHIALASEPLGEASPIIEIFLGGWENSKSAIRFNREKPDKSEASTPSICSADELKTFVVTWTVDGDLNVALEGASEPFLSWKNDQPFPIRYIGVRTSWGSSGEWKIDGAKELQTPDSMDYQWIPVHNAVLNFSVKAKNDAHVALAGGPSYDNPIYEVFIGGWNNTKCAIRYNKEKPDVSEAEGCLSGDEFKKFWIKLSHAAIQVGRDGDSAPFLSWTNPEPIVVSHYGIRTSWGSDGHWYLDVEGAIPEGEVNVEEREKRDVPSLEGVKWVAASGGEVPEGALAAGEDNGQPLYIARAPHNDAVIPGKLLAEHGVCYVPWGGEEHGKDTYEVLVISPDAVSWVDASGDTAPPNAIQGGSAEDGEALFIGRATHEGALTPGKYHPSHQTLYLSYGGQEVGIGSGFQVLVKN